MKTRNTASVYQPREAKMSDQEIKQRIHDKALDHFLRFGFSKVTMNEIAEELGMSKKTLYQYFPGKEELLAAVVARMHEDTATEIETIVDDTGIDFVQKLQKALDILAAFHAKMAPYIMADLEKHAPEVCKASNDFRRDRIRNIMSKLVGEGIEKGIFRGDIDEELIVLIYAGALQHLLRPETFNQLGLSVSQIHQAIGSVIIEGIARPDTRKEILSQIPLKSSLIAGERRLQPVAADGRAMTAARRNPGSSEQ
ncbi:MAG TPA: TetR/AcrR family transcriptional regulator [Bacteroidota bacterium]